VISFFTLVRILGICALCIFRLLIYLVRSDKPHEDPNIRGDAFKTLIVARLSYDATEQDLESEFGRFGPIERVCSLEYFSKDSS
jgi:hypothetical protein